MCLLRNIEIFLIYLRINQEMIDVCFLGNCHEVLLIDTCTFNTDIFLDDTCYARHFLHKRFVGFNKIRYVREHIISTDLLKDECQVLLLNPFTVLAGINLDDGSHVFE